MVKLPEDGEAWLVDGEDHSLPSSGEPGHTVECLTEPTLLQDTETVVNSQHANDWLSC